VRRMRFIPACAGNAHFFISRIEAEAVHPRVCGERDVGPLLVDDDDGSSPRVRGTRRPACLTPPRRRFIPACAGNAQTARNRPASASVHPRVCGERIEDSDAEHQTAGSSPRVRGTRRDPAAPQEPRRFIPACAGNASARTPRRPSREVHPRVCGERSHRDPLRIACRGSSPRVRGTQRQGARHRVAGRFIPACAGNAAGPFRTRDIEAVHPRVCGERATGSSTTALSTGSSPRVRGTPAEVCP